MPSGVAILRYETILLSKCVWRMVIIAVRALFPVKYQEACQPLPHSSILSLLTPYFHHCRHNQKFLSYRDRINKKHQFYKISDVYVKLSVNKTAQIKKGSYADHVMT